MSFGRGSVYYTSSKQKSDTNSSTEAELVGTSDGASQILWTSHLYVHTDQALRKVGYIRNFGVLDS